MVNQQFFIPMVPDSAPIVINVAQNDYDADGYTGRLIFNLINNGAPYDMDGASAVFEGKKPDGTAFSYYANVVSASVVRVNLRPQMTSVEGRVVCNLVLTNTDGVVGSYNVWLEVQQSALVGTDPSQTDIPTIIAAMNDAVDRAEQAADDAESWSEHPPYIGANGNWFVYDTTTDLYVDSGYEAQGRSGNKWYEGTDVNGKSTTPTAYPTGITYAYVNDQYLNPQEAAVYHCTQDGNDTTALWVFDFVLTGAASTLSSLTDVSISSPANDQLLTYDNGQWKNKAPDKSYVRYAGAIQFADLATNHATYLNAAYEDAFFLITDGGQIGSGEASAYWTSNFSDGDTIPADSHIAVINVNRGTALPASYKYDDFGGFVDISDKADKTDIFQWVTTSKALGSTSVTINNALFKTTSYIILLADDGTGESVAFTDYTVTTGKLVIKFPALKAATEFAIGVYNPV